MEGRLSVGWMGLEAGASPSGEETIQRKISGGAPKGVVTQADDDSLIQEVGEELVEGHAETSQPAPRKMLNRPHEPTSGTPYKEHDLHMCLSSRRDSEGPSYVVSFSYFSRLI